MTDEEHREEKLHRLANSYKVGPPKSTKESDDSLIDTLIELSWHGVITGAELVKLAAAMQCPLWL